MPTTTPSPNPLTKDEALWRGKISIVRSVIALRKPSNHPRQEFLRSSNRSLPGYFDPHSVSCKPDGREKAPFRPSVSKTPSLLPSAEREALHRTSFSDVLKHSPAPDHSPQPALQRYFLRTSALVEVKAVPLHRERERLQPLSPKLPLPSSNYGWTSLSFILT